MDTLIWAACEMRKLGMTYSEISQITGHCTDWVYRHCCSVEIPPENVRHKRGITTPPEVRADMKAMREAGEPLRVIAAKYGLSRQRIQQVMEAIGVPFRKKQHWPIVGFKKRMYAALYEHGYRRCHAPCGMWKPRSEFGLMEKEDHCLECCRERSKQRRQAGLSDWQKAHRKNVNEATKRYRDRKLLGLPRLTSEERGRVMQEVWRQRRITPGETSSNAV